MKKVKGYHVETADIRFMIDIYEEPSGSYMAEYFGATPKFAQVMQPGGAMPMMQDVPGGKLRDNDIDELFERACAEIVRQHGNIERRIEM
jgi:hypothetical protein